MHCHDGKENDMAMQKSYVEHVTIHVIMDGKKEETTENQIILQEIFK
jgi:uncharacterized membrane-anchored protein